MLIRVGLAYVYLLECEYVCVMSVLVVLCNLKKVLTCLFFKKKQEKDRLLIVYVQIGTGKAW